MVLTNKNNLEAMICIGEDDGKCFLNNISDDVYCPNYDLKTGECKPLNYTRVDVEFRVRDYVLKKN